MKKIYCLSLVVLIFFENTVSAQAYDIVIKGGHVIDARNNIDAVMDVAIAHGKVIQLGNNIDAKLATQVVDAKGMYVTPGLIDLHAHLSLIHISEPTRQAEIS